MANYPFKKIIVIDYTASKPYLIEKTKLQYNFQGMLAYYQYLQPFIKPNYRFYFYFFKLYVMYIAPFIHSYIRRLKSLLHKKLKIEFSLTGTYILSTIYKMSIIAKK